jgi:hypothetical protein
MLHDHCLFKEEVLAAVKNKTVRILFISVSKLCFFRPKVFLLCQSPIFTCNIQDGNVTIALVSTSEAVRLYTELESLLGPSIEALNRTQNDDGVQEFEDLK